MFIHEKYEQEVDLVGKQSKSVFYILKAYCPTEKIPSSRTLVDNFAQHDVGFIDK